MCKIVINGMGIVSAIGNNVSETLQSLLGGKSGLSEVKYIKTEHIEFPVGEVKISNDEMINLLNFPSNVPTTRAALMGMLAVKEALIDSMQLDISRKDKNVKNTLFENLNICFINGTTVGGMDKSEQFYFDFLENDTKNAYISTHDCGACTEIIADYFGIFSQVQTISTACSSAANAILQGAEILKSGRADIVVAGGTECITKFHLNGFNTLMILDKEPCRVFDATRAGLNLGEGAAYVVMQRSDSLPISAYNNSKKSSSVFFKKPIVALSGYANTCDAFHQTASSPDGEGAYLAMKKALENAALQPRNIDYINAHGTGTQNNDLSEGTAIMRLFANCPNDIPPVSSTKAFTGHTTSAAGSVEAIISILALKHNFIPDNLNFKNKMEELSFVPYFADHCSIDKDPLKKQKLASQAGNNKMKHVLSNSFGFGGNDTSLIFSEL